ncbi:pseudouridine synthase [Asticcacaulis sp.]|uniref:pseudouridine synthase n=1 Tax=Asticcacaulis sp. TaxID=1872648 RepID=UPI0039E681DA
MTQDSNAGERNEPQNESERELTPQEIQAAKELQEIADGHRYMPQDMRDAKEAAGKKDRAKKPAKTDAKPAANTGERIAKVLARAGLASRREIERLIGLGKIAVNGRILETPAVLVKATDVITVDGQEVGKAEPTRLWRYHKPVGLVTTERDPSGRPTVFDKLPADLPRVLKVGRLDLNSEGLLLLTNDGELARALELPSAGWVRRYRARALGHTTQARLDTLKDGTTVDGVIYGPMEATLDKVAEKADGRANCWVTVSITEGKNREVRKVLESIGLKVNRLIRLAYGPFQLGNLEVGEVEEVGPRVIRELLADVVPLKNLPPEGASQTRSRPAAHRDAEAPAGRRGGGDRFEKKAFGDKPAFGAKKFGDKKFGDKPKEWKPRTEFEKRDYKDRDFDERPRFEGDGEARDRRPSREGDFADRKSFGEKKWTPRAESGERKSYGDRPAFRKPYAAREDGERKSYGDRPKRDFGDRPRSDRPQGDRPFKKPYAKRDDNGIPAGESGAYERAKREFGGASREDRGEKKWTPRPERGDRPQGDRPAFKKPYASRDNAGGERAYGDRPRRDFGDRPPRAEGDRPAFKKPYASRDNAGGERAYGDRPRRDFGDRPPRAEGDRPAFKKPYAARDGESRGPKRDYAPREGGERKAYGDRPSSGGFKGKPGGRPSGGRPTGDRPSGGPRPGGKPGFKPRRDS